MNNGATAQRENVLSIIGDFIKLKTTRLQDCKTTRQIDK